MKQCNKPFWRLLVSERDDVLRFGFSLHVGGLEPPNGNVDSESESLIVMVCALWYQNPPARRHIRMKEGGGIYYLIASVIQKCSANIPLKLVKFLKSVWLSPSCRKSYLQGTTVRFFISVSMAALVVRVREPLSYLKLQ